MAMTAEEFRKLRMRCGLTRKEAAFESGYSYSTWSGFENGFKPVTFKAETFIRSFYEQQELRSALARLQKENDSLRRHFRSQSKEARP